MGRHERVRIPCRPLTEDQFKRLFQVEGWGLYDISPLDWCHLPWIPRFGNTLAILSSGSIVDPRILNGVEAVAGFDHLVFEDRPKPGEPQGNAYHYYVVKNDAPEKYPYTLYGPVTSETWVQHWFSADGIEVYWHDTDDKDPETNR